MESRPRNPMVLVQDVKKTYRPRNTAPTVALRGVSLTVEEGQAVAIVGPSGSGKSTLLSIIGTLETADSGSINVLGQEVIGLGRTKSAEFRFWHLGFVFQQYHLLPGLTVFENLLARFIGRSRPVGITVKAEALLDEIGLLHKRSALPRELSGGEQQRVCIARALLSDPSLILADEPTGNLDTQNGEKILEMMLSMVRSRGAGLILVTHNQVAAGRMDRIVEIRDGLVFHP